jgi:hypothetical protein
MLPARKAVLNRRIQAMFTSKEGRGRPGKIAAGALLALVLSVSGALAQTAAPPANHPVAAPKQVGVWTVTGWSQGYCSASRPLRGVTAEGGTLEFVVARLRIGYRIALSAPEWELTPRTSFPVELVADPVWHSDATAVAAGPKVVVIDLGASEAFMKKLGIAPVLEVKAAQATFKLPLEAFEGAVAELDACFAALKRPTSNPFAAAAPAAKTAQNN